MNIPLHQQWFIWLLEGSAFQLLHQIAKKKAEHNINAEYYESCHKQQIIYQTIVSNHYCNFQSNRPHLIGQNRPLIFLS
jgi:hypothetical protein